MIAYNPKDWFTFIFRFHKADTFRKLLLMICCISLYAWLIAWLELEVWNLSKDNSVKNLVLLHNLLGFVLSLLLVFRTNTAYDRWWEGRKLWGALVNNSRNLALKLDVILDKTLDKERKFFENLIPAYAAALANHLSKETLRLELDEMDHPELKAIDKNKHVPNQIASLLLRKAKKLYHDKKLTDAEYININAELSSFTDVCGACERIKNTPIPFSYSLFIKKFIFFYIMTLPFGFVFSLGYWVIPVVAFIFYVLASLELIGEEVEDPFGDDTNDLPLIKIAANIKKNVGDIL
jgi:ion channel-forming bestrophin family protein